MSTYIKHNGEWKRTTGVEIKNEIVDFPKVKYYKVTTGSSGAINKTISVPNLEIGKLYAFTFLHSFGTHNVNGLQLSIESGGTVIDYHLGQGNRFGFIIFRATDTTTVFRVKRTSWEGSQNEEAAVIAIPQYNGYRTTIASSIVFTVESSDINRPCVLIIGGEYRDFASGTESLGMQLSTRNPTNTKCNISFDVIKNTAITVNLSISKQAILIF